MRLAPFLVLAASCGLLGHPRATVAQELDTDLWVTNGTVYAVARFGETVYMGGSFTELSPPSGSGVVFNTTTGDTLPGFPRVVGRVYTVAPDLSGGWYLGGLFTSVGGQPRQNIAHVSSSLTVSSWDPGADGAVLAITPSLSGTVYAGGDFTTIGGQARQRIAELNASGAATAWNPTASSTVRALGVISGSVYAAGDFTFIGGQGRARVARLSPTTGFADTWNPGVNGPVHALEIGIQGSPLSPTVTILVGGAFSVAGGQPRANLAEFSTAGAATAWNPSPNGLVSDILERDVIYVAGEFTSIAGFPRNRVAKLDPTNGQAHSWNPNANGAVRSLVWAASNVFLGGEFTEVGGQPSRRLARVDDGFGLPAPWLAEANQVVRALCLGSPGIYAGGDFTGLSGLPRRNLAAFDLARGRPADWAPEADAPVRALALGSYGPTLYRVYVGGDFTSIFGQPRERLAELDAYSGFPTSFAVSAGPTGSVFAMSLLDSILYLGGTFSNLGGTGVSEAGAVNVRTQTVNTAWDVDVDGPVYAILATPTAVYLGGSFTTLEFFNPRSRIGAVHPTTGNVLTWNPGADGTVRALLVAPGTVYAGGDFSTFGGVPRARIGAVSTAGAISPFNPGANGIVRALARWDAGIFVGGDFTSIAGQPRGRLAYFTPAGDLDAWTADVADREVYALAAKGQVVVAGGSFRGVGTTPAGNLAGLDASPPPNCPPLGPDTWPVGANPRAMTSLDIDQDGIRDLALATIGDGSVPPFVTVLRGGGTAGVWDGSFTTVNTLPLYGPPVRIARGDFDSDGRDDLAVGQNADVGWVDVWLNAGGGSFTPGPTTWMFGRIAGLDIEDMNQDGVLDLVVGLVDSLSTPASGGIVVSRGEGSGGVWSGTFTAPQRKESPRPASVTASMVHDLNQDGASDVALVDNGFGRHVIKYQSGGVFGGTEYTLPSSAFSEAGASIVSGDLNDDGKPDLVHARRVRGVAIGRNESPLDPLASVFWFSPPNQAIAIALPSSARDLALLDFDQDGNLDLAVSYDSLGLVEIHPGTDSAGVSTGTFGPATPVAGIDASVMVAEDFDGDGAPDLAVVQGRCGTVTVIRSGANATLPLGLTLTSPNGGEQWPWAAQVPPAEGPVASLSFEDESVALAAPASDPLPELAGARFITWEKGAGIQGVDVELSRDGGATWKTIGSNLAGTSMRWVVTPPASANALIRIHEHGIRTRFDVADAPFAIEVTTTDVEGLPAVAAFLGLHANPARGGAIRFRLDAPRAVDADVTVFDVAGRRVHTILEGPVAPGSHMVTWDGRTHAGRAAGRGIYFVRARSGSLDVTRKVVLLD